MSINITMATTARRDHLYIFNGSSGYKQFQFAVLARTEQDARRRLLATAESENYHEFQGCYAPSAKEVFTQRIVFESCVSGECVESDFKGFVSNTKVTVKDPTPVMFSSCLDG
jgi:hypothetical protein